MIPANDFTTFEMAIIDYLEVDRVVTSFQWANYHYFMVQELSFSKSEDSLAQG